MKRSVRIEICVGLQKLTVLYDDGLEWSSYRTVVLNQGSIEPQGFGEAVSGVRRQEILSDKSKK